MKQYKTSVLMSVYVKDNPDFLGIALNSIYDNQTVKPDEIVVVFDGLLTAELYDVLNRFRVGKETIVKYIQNEKNQGLGEALRIGSELCTGDLIFRMDSDDVSDPNRFEKQILYLKDNPNCDVIGTNIGEFEFDYHNVERVRSCPKTKDEIIKMARHRNPMNHVSVCMKKEALIKCGGYESLLLLEDYYLWLKMIVSGCELANIDETLVYVRVGNGFINKRRAKERVKGWKILQKYMLNNKLITKFDSIVNMIYIFCFTYSPSFIKNFAYNNILRKKIKK